MKTRIDGGNDNPTRRVTPTLLVRRESQRTPALKIYLRDIRI